MADLIQNKKDNKKDNYVFKSEKNMLSSEKKSKLKKNVSLVLIGAVIGLVNGVFGGGGGMIAIPLLSFALNYPSKTAHATTMGIMLPLSVASGITYVCSQKIEWFTLLWVTVGSVGGGIVGAFCLKKIKAKWLPRIFAILIAMVGVKLMFF